MRTKCRIGVAAAAAAAVQASLLVCAIAVKAAAPCPEGVLAPRSLAAVELTNAKSPTKTIGPITFSAGKMVLVWALNHHENDLSHGFDIRSAAYHLTGDKAVMTFSSTGPASDFSKIVATGDGDQQVRAEFLDSTDRWVVLKSDQVVVLPNSSVPEGRTATFTGHVKITASSAKDLVVPSDTTVDSAVVYMGIATDRPRLEADGVNGSAVPVPSSQK